MDLRIALNVMLVDVGYTARLEKLRDIEEVSPIEHHFRSEKDFSRNKNTFAAQQTGSEHKRARSNQMKRGKK